MVARRQQEDFERSGDEIVDETQIFDGAKNSLIMSQTYTHDFQCMYQLERYPFDKQVVAYN